MSEQESEQPSRPSAERLAVAAETGDLAGVRAALDAGLSPDGIDGEAPPLWRACASDAPSDIRLQIVEMLLAAGADPLRAARGATPLHLAAARGPLALVERLIACGAIEWQPDSRGRSPLELARAGAAPDHDDIVALLDRPVIADSQFRAAVTAIQTGELNALQRLLDEAPHLLLDRAREPDCYRQTSRPQYFLDPKLFWFIANNPSLVDRPPTNIVAIAEAMIARGVEAADLDYALELVMTSASARESGLQLPLMTVLLDAGAAPSERSIASALAHKELEPVQALLAAGAPLTAPIAAALGRADVLATLLSAASPADVQLSLALAIVNGRLEAAKVALDSGADPNQFMPVHAHSAPLHQAALSNDVELLKLLIAHDARTDIRDKIWNGTPLDWAVHEGKTASRDYLASLSP